MLVERCVTWWLGSTRSRVVTLSVPFMEKENEKPGKYCQIIPKAKKNFNSWETKLILLTKLMKCLPPTEDCLKKHIQRANHEAFIWKRSLVAFIVPANPVGNGWELKHDELTIQWMTSYVPQDDQLLEFVNCGCKKGCKTQKMFLS